jgi:hypothetical protein
MKFIKVFLLFFLPAISVYGKQNEPEIKSKIIRPNDPTINFTVTVIDKNTSRPLQSVVIEFNKGNVIIASGATNAFGRALFYDLGADSAIKL